MIRASAALARHRPAIRQIVARHHAANPRVFGSVARGEDIAGSDLDLLVDPMAQTTLFDLGAIIHEVSALLGVEVDVLTPNALPPRLRSQVLAEAVPV